MWLQNPCVLELLVTPVADPGGESDQGGCIERVDDGPRDLLPCRKDRTHPEQWETEDARGSEKEKEDGRTVGQDLFPLGTPP